jgi:hypothetical protein
MYCVKTLDGETFCRCELVERAAELALFLTRETGEIHSVEVTE